MGLAELSVQERKEVYMQKQHIKNLKTFSVFSSHRFCLSCKSHITPILTIHPSSSCASAENWDLEIHLVHLLSFHNNNYKWLLIKAKESWVDVSNEYFISTGYQTMFSTHTRLELKTLNSETVQKHITDITNVHSP